MKYDFNGKILNIPEAELDKSVKCLGISREEAIQLWLDDNDYTINETVEELSEKAKKNRITGTIHQAKADNSQKKERKPHPPYSHQLQPYGLLCRLHIFLLFEPNYLVNNHQQQQSHIAHPLVFSNYPFISAEYP